MKYAYHYHVEFKNDNGHIISDGCGMIYTKNKVDNDNTYKEVIDSIVRKFDNNMTSSSHVVLTSLSFMHEKNQDEINNQMV